MSVLKDLFFGNLSLPEQASESLDKAETEQLMKECSDARKALTDSLTDGQRAMLEAFISANDRLALATEAAAFSCGFSVACRLLVEALKP